MRNEPMITFKGLRDAGANIFLALLYAGFVIRYGQSFLNQPRLSHLLLFVMPSLALVFSLIRTDAQKVRHSPWVWLVTTGGTFMPLVLYPAGSGDVLLGDVLQMIGLGLQIAAIISLNRSFGVLPAYRTIKRFGCYRFVRHPLYCAYTIGLVGFAINNPSPYNFGIVAVDTMFQLLRIRCEEGLLFKYPDYAAYARQTRWRLLPLVW